MKRDMDVIRAIVLAVRDDHRDRLVKIEGVEPNVFKFHAHLLVEAGLAEGKVHKMNSGAVKFVELHRLTWVGHDFADSITDETLWKKAKNRLMAPSLVWTFDILKEVLAGLIKERLDL